MNSYEFGNAMETADLAVMPMLANCCCSDVTFFANFWYEMVEGCESCGMIIAVEGELPLIVVASVAMLLKRAYDRQNIICFNL